MAEPILQTLSAFSLVLVGAAVLSIAYIFHNKMYVMSRLLAEPGIKPYKPNASIRRIKSIVLLLLWLGFFANTNIKIRYNMNKY